MKKTLLVIVLIGALISAKGQDLTSLTNIISMIPTTALTNGANTFFSTGVWDGPSVNTQNGQVATVEQNYLQGEVLEFTNVSFDVTARNTLNHFDAVGGHLGYSSMIGNIRLTLKAGGGQDIDNYNQFVDGLLDAKYQIMGGTPYIHAAYGYEQVLSAHSRGGQQVFLGVTIPFKH